MPSRPFLKSVLVPGLFCLGLLAWNGCASLPSSGIDPSGERLFTKSLLGSATSPTSNSPASGYTPNISSRGAYLTPLDEDRDPMDLRPEKPSLISHFDDCSLFKNLRRKAPAAAAPPVTASETPSAAPITQPTDSTLPGGFGSVTPGTSPPGAGISTATAGNRVYGITTAIIPEPGSGIGAARPVSEIKGPALVMTPAEQIAPVGSEVVLVSSFLGNDQHLRTNEPIEWSLDGVGHIFSIDPGHLCDPLLFDYKRPKKHSDKFASTKTSSHYQTVHRGTADTRDDLKILKGQSWISLNAMKEGTTYVTAVATNMKDWSKRSDTATIHWVDARWVLPTPMIAAVGTSRLLTTTVQRQTNGAPRSGWKVRYEIVAGPSAGFGERQTQVEEVLTDLAGQASVTLTQTSAQQGTTLIAIRIIRPEGAEGIDRAVTLGNETFRQVWTTGGTLSIQNIGPKEASVGQELDYRIIVTNNGNASSAAQVALPVPPGMKYVRSNPPAALVRDNSTGGTTLQWDVNEIRPRQSLTQTVTLIAEQRGRSYNVLAQVLPRTAFGTLPGTTAPSLPQADPYPAVPGSGPTASPFSPTQPTSPSTPSTGPSAAAYPGGSSASGTTANTNKPVDVRLEVSPRLPSETGPGVFYSLVVRNNTALALNNVTLILRPVPNLNAVAANKEAVPLSDGSVQLSLPSIPAGGDPPQLRIQYTVAAPIHDQKLRGEMYVNGALFDTAETTLNLVP